MQERIFEGSLKAVNAPDLLTFINLIKKTGTLTLSHGDRTQKVFWERGEMIFAASSVPEESLGAFLVRHGKITPEQNMKSGLQVEPGKRQGRILVQMGILTPKELWWAVKNQVLDIIYSVFSVREGWFTFEETAQPHEEKIKLSTSTTNIIMEGIRRLDEWPRIKEIIPHDRVTPRLAPHDKRDSNVRFLEAERAILDLVDGQRNVRDIIHHSNMDEFETLRLLMAFVMARYIHVPEGRAGEGRDDVEDVQDLDAVVESFNRVFGQIGAYLVHYADGSEREIPLLFAEDIGSWWRDPQLPRSGERTVIAWTGTNVPASRSRHHDMLALYKATWENPEPNRQVECIDFLSALTACSPFLIAVTAE